jgi:Fe-S cluster assembly protein SufB
MSTAAELLTNREYKYGFVTDIESDVIPKGLSEDTVRLISSKKNEPEWMLEFRLKAFRNWLKMTEPNYWANFEYPRIDFQNISYYSAPRQKPKKTSMDEVDPELIKTFEKLGFRYRSRRCSRMSRSMRSSIQSPLRRPTKKN